MTDKDLLRRVELKRNAANAHDVNQTICNYQSYARAFEKCPEREKQYQYLKAKFTSLTFILSEFADTGDIKAAIKNHPTWKFVKAEENSNVAN